MDPSSKSQADAFRDLFLKDAAAQAHELKILDY